MRIAIMTHMYPAHSETFQRREAEALQALGHEVVAFTRAQPTGPAVGSRVEARPQDEVKAFAPDVLYGALSMSSGHLAAWRYSQILQKPFALRIWSGLDSFAHPSPELYGGITSDQRCLGAIVEDAFMAEWAVSAMGLRCRISAVPNSLDLSSFVPAPIPADQPVILAVGRLVEKKGFIHLIRACRKLKNPAALMIVGDGPERRSLEAEGGALFTGNISEGQLRECYAQCYCLVAPCVRTSNGDGDGIPTVVLEAMAAGRPVIASELLSAGQYIDHGLTGFLVPAGQPEALAAAIDELLSDRARAEAMGRAGRAWAEEHLGIRKNILRIESVLKGTA